MAHNYKDSGMKHMDTRIVRFEDYNQVPQGPTKKIDEFCFEALYDNGISKELHAVTDETLIALGKPDSLMNNIYIFRIIQELREKELPELTRQGLKPNGKITKKKWNGYTITKRTLTIGDVSLWEYIYKKSDDDWIILHRYAPKIQYNKNGQQKQKAPQTNIALNEHNSNKNTQDNWQNSEELDSFVNNDIEGNDNENNQLDSETPHVMENSQDNWQNYSELDSFVNNNIDGNDSDNENYFYQDGANSNQNNQHEVGQCLQILTEAWQNPRMHNENIEPDVNEIMEDVDGILPDAPSTLYLKLLRESIAKKKFFNKPIKIYDELLQFKLASDDLMEDEDDDASNGGLDHDSDEVEEEEIISFSELTQDGFQFIIDNKLIHLTSPGGTGKTMTIWQLAKSVDEYFRRKLVPVAIKAEHYYHQIKLEDQFNFQYLSVEALVRGSMHTAEVKNIEDQQIWCQNLEATIQNGTGIILLIDALDEMKSRDREEFLKHIEFLTANLPGLIKGEVNLVALVVSSRPGLTLPTDSEELSWLQLELIEHDDSEHVLQILCAPGSAVYTKALELCEHYEFPKYLFWYSLLVIEAETMDANSTLTASQFDFLGGLLLRSIRTTKDKKTSLDADQSAMLNEDATYLLLIAGLIAYIAKVRQTTRIADLEQELSFLMTDMSFPKSIIDSRGSVIKKLLPVLQFCHCCTSCTEDSEDKLIVFDHLIVFDYLVASFIIKTILQQTHPSLKEQITANPSLAFDWPHYVTDTARYDSEWLQVMHLIADALPVGDFITTIKQCRLDEAEAWLSNIANHPRCYDIEDPTLAYIKLIVSCLFNASRKSVSTAKTSHKNKKSKKESSHSDSSATRLSFEVLIKLFSQPVIGQLIIEDICQIKSLSLLFDELTQQNLHGRFIQIFIDKFNAPSSEQRMPEELVTLAIRFFNIGNPEINSTIQDGLFNRLSSRCATEPVSSPMTRAIQFFFRKIQAFGYLIDKLASDDELEVASAIPMLLGFKTYRTMFFIQIDALLMEIAQHQSLPPDEVMPRLPGPSVLNALLACGSLTWLEIKHACRYFDNEHFSWLRETIRHYYGSIKQRSAQTREVILPGHFDWYSRKKSKTLLAFGMAGKPTSKGFVHDVTQEQTQIFAGCVEIASVMLKARDEHKPLAELEFIDDQLVPVPFKENTVEEALILLDRNAEKISVQFDTRVRRNLVIHRCHYVQLVADNVLAQLFTLIDQLTSAHITLLIGYANDCFCLKGTRKEWYPVINYNSLENLLVALCSEDRSFQWSPETVVQLWQFLGTDCYQFYLEEFYHDQVFPDLIEEMTAKWSIEEARILSRSYADGFEIQIAI